MNKKIDERQKMFNAVIKFFDSDIPDGKTIPEIMQTSFAELKAIIAGFHDKAVAQKVSTIGNTSGKQEQKSTVCLEAGVLSKMLRSYARKTKNVVLLDNARHKKWSLMKLRESDIVYQCTEIFNLAVSNMAGLQGMGLSQASMDSVQGNLKLYADQVVQSRAVVVEKTGLKSSMRNLHGDAMNVLINQVDPLMDLLAGTYPEWVESYRLMRTVVKQPGTRSKISGVVTATGNLKGIRGISVNVADSKEKRLTRPKGLFNFRRIEPGTYTLVVSGDGYQTKELPNVMVSPGQTTHVAVELEKL